MNPKLKAGDSVRLVSDGFFGGEDETTRARGLYAGQVYRVKAIHRDKRGVEWVELFTVGRPGRKYLGWAPFRFEVVRNQP